MPDDRIIIIDAGPDGRPVRRSPLYGRRFISACVLALAEVVALMVWRPGAIIGTLVALVLLIAAVALLSRSGPGLWRDLLAVVAGAQALIIVVPALLAASLLFALLIGGLILVALVAYAVRPRGGGG